MKGKVKEMNLTQAAKVKKGDTIVKDGKEYKVLEIRGSWRGFLKTSEIKNRKYDFYHFIVSKNPEIDFYHMEVELKKER